VSSTNQTQKLSQKEKNSFIFFPTSSQKESDSFHSATIEQRAAEGELEEILFYKIKKQ
jgi:hypothetical protein